MNNLKWDVGCFGKGEKLKVRNSTRFTQLFPRLCSNICTWFPPSPFACLFLSLCILQWTFPFFLLSPFHSDLPGRISCSTFSSPRTLGSFRGLCPGPSELAYISLGRSAFPGLMLLLRLSINFLSTHTLFQLPPSRLLSSLLMLLALLCRSIITVLFPQWYCPLLWPGDSIFHCLCNFSVSCVGPTHGGPSNGEDCTFPFAYTHPSTMTEFFPL